MFSILTNMVIMYVDIVLLMILLCLILCVCTYCVVRIRRLQQSGQVTILLRPTKVMFSHKNEDNGKEELRTVVAYQNPFTGDYCVHKSRPPKGYLNALPPESPDSGVSDEYEPLKPVRGPGREGDYGPFNIQEHGSLQNVDNDHRNFHSMSDQRRVFQSMDDGQSAFQSMNKGRRAFQSMGDQYREFKSLDDGEGVFQSMDNGHRAFQSMGDQHRQFQIMDNGHRERQSTGDVNSVNRTWNWNYKEYQI